jgi:hypothetical protein
MISQLFTHKQYLRFVKNQARHFGGLRANHRHIQVWRKLKATNLDQAHPILASLYDADKGCPARQPVCMLRSCLAMLECGVTDFEAWVALMRDEPFYALISGFHPHDLPGVGTFYDFQDRLLHRPRQPRTIRRRPYRRRDQRDKADQHRVYRKSVGEPSKPKTRRCWPIQKPSSILV